MWRFCIQLTFSCTLWFGVCLGSQGKSCFWCRTPKLPHGSEQIFAVHMLNFASNAKVLLLVPNGLKFQSVCHLHIFLQLAVLLKPFTINRWGEFQTWSVTCTISASTLWVFSRATLIICLFMPTPRYHWASYGIEHFYIMHEVFHNIFLHVVNLLKLSGPHCKYCSCTKGYRVQSMSQY